MRKHTAAALTAIALMAFAPLSSAQAPAPTPAPTPAPKDDDVTPLRERSLDAPKSKSDAYRLVGKVVAIDAASGAVKLATEEGEKTVQPSRQLLAAIRVGDTISVPRADGPPPANASPRTAPRPR
jgi:hypothetical protein